MEIEVSLIIGLSCGSNPKDSKSTLLAEVLFIMVARYVDG